MGTSTRTRWSLTLVFALGLSVPAFGDGGYSAGSEEESGTSSATTESGMSGEISDDQYSEQDVDISESQPSEMDTESGVTESRPSEMETESGVTEAQPSEMETESGVTEGQPSEMETESGVTEAQPSEMETESGVTEAQPSATVSGMTERESELAAKKSAQEAKKAAAEARRAQAEAKRAEAEAKRAEMEAKSAELEASRVQQQAEFEASRMQQQAELAEEEAAEEEAEEEATISGVTEAMREDEAKAMEEGEEAAAAPVTAEMRAARPEKRWKGVIRLIPTVGASSFTSDQDLEFDNFDNGVTYGLFADFGPGHWVFETGVLGMHTDDIPIEGQTGTILVKSWGIPLLAKFNFRNNPNQTMFLKAGIMPFQPDTEGGDFEILGVAGLGGAIPLFKNTSLTLEATYNRLFDEIDRLGPYQGVSLLGGISIGL